MLASSKIIQQNATRQKNNSVPAIVLKMYSKYITKINYMILQNFIIDIGYSEEKLRSDYGSFVKLLHLMLKMMQQKYTKLTKEQLQNEVYSEYKLIKTNLTKNKLIELLFTLFIKQLFEERYYSIETLKTKTLNELKAIAKQIQMQNYSQLTKNNLIIFIYVNVNNTLKFMESIQESFENDDIYDDDIDDIFGTSNNTNTGNNMMQSADDIFGNTSNNNNTRQSVVDDIFNINNTRQSADDIFGTNTTNNTNTSTSTSNIKHTRKSKPTAKILRSKIKNSSTSESKTNNNSIVNSNDSIEDIEDNDKPSLVHKLLSIVPQTKYYTPLTEQQQKDEFETFVTQNIKDERQYKLLKQQQANNKKLHWYVNDVMRKNLNKNNFDFMKKVKESERTHNFEWIKEHKKGNEDDKYVDVMYDYLVSQERHNVSYETEAELFANSLELDTETRVPDIHTKCIFPLKYTTDCMSKDQAASYTRIYSVPFLHSLDYMWCYDVDEFFSFVMRNIFKHHKEVLRLRLREKSIEIGCMKKYVSKIVEFVRMSRENCNSIFLEDKNHPSLQLLSFFTENELTSLKIVNPAYLYYQKTLKNVDGFSALLENNLNEFLTGNDILRMHEWRVAYHDLRRLKLKTKHIDHLNNLDAYIVSTKVKDRDSTWYNRVSRQVSRNVSFRAKQLYKIFNGPGSILILHSIYSVIRMLICYTFLLNTLTTFFEDNGNSEQLVRIFKHKIKDSDIPKYAALFRRKMLMPFLYQTLFGRATLHIVDFFYNVGHAAWKSLKNYIPNVVTQMIGWTSSFFDSVGEVYKFIEDNTFGAKTYRYIYLFLKYSFVYLALPYFGVLTPNSPLYVFSQLSTLLFRNFRSSFLQIVTSFVPENIVSTIQEGNDLNSILLILKFYNADRFSEQLCGASENCKYALTTLQKFLGYGIFVSIILNSFKMLYAYVSDDCTTLIDIACDLKVENSVDIEKGLNQIENEEGLLDLMKSNLLEAV